MYKKNILNKLLFLIDESPTGVYWTRELIFCSKDRWIKNCIFFFELPGYILFTKHTQIRKKDIYKIFFYIQFLSNKYITLLFDVIVFLFYFKWRKLLTHIYILDKAIKSVILFLDNVYVIKIIKCFLNIRQKWLSTNLHNYFSL